jgi:hypothetical protein
MAPRMAAALALLALVGLASTAKLDSDQALSTSGLAFVAIVVVVVAALVIGVGATALTGGYAIFPDNRRKLVAALLMAALLAVLIALLLAPADAPLDEGGVGSGTRRDPGEGDDYFRLTDSAFGGIAIAVIAGLALLPAALLVVESNVDAQLSSSSEVWVRRVE